MTDFIKLRCDCTVGTHCPQGKIGQQHKCEIYVDRKRKLDPMGDEHTFSSNKNINERALSWLSALYQDAKDGDIMASLLITRIYEQNKDM